MEPPVESSPSSMNSETAAETEPAYVRTYVRSEGIERGGGRRGGGGWGESTRGGTRAANPRGENDEGVIGEFDELIVAP